MPTFSIENTKFLKRLAGESADHTYLVSETRPSAGNLSRGDIIFYKYSRQGDSTQKMGMVVQPPTKVSIDKFGRGTHNTLMQIFKLTPTEEMTLESLSDLYTTGTFLDKNSFRTYIVDYVHGVHKLSIVKTSEQE